MFTKFICDFIDSNAKTFFCFYPANLCHQPFSPTPDDADYAKWDPLKNASNERYFPGMVNYFDKKTGEIMSKVYANNLQSNTIIIFSADNGNSKEITSLWRGDSIQGGKGTTTRYGTHVPLIVAQPGNKAGQHFSKRFG